MRFFIIFTLFLIVSCKKKQELPDLLDKNTIVFNDSNIDPKLITNLASEELANISDSIIFSTQILVNNDYLIINENRSEKFLHLIRLPQEKYLGSYGSKGRGPGEIISPHFLSKTNNQIRIFDLMGKKIIEFQIDSLIKTNLIKKEYFLKEDTQVSAALVYNKNIYSTGFDFLKSRLTETSIITRESVEYGELPKLSSKVPEHIKGQVYGASMANNSNNFVFNYLNYPLIQILNIDTNESTKILGPEIFEPKYKIKKVNGAEMFRFSKETRMAYIDVKLYDGYIYALFNGKKMNEGMIGENANTIYVFDYTGKVIKKFILDKGIVKFDIYDGKTIYGISAGDIFKILKFQL